MLDRTMKEMMQSKKDKGNVRSDYGRNKAMYDKSMKEIRHC